jgi:hypothetical protein
MTLGETMARVLPIDGAKRMNESLAVPMIFDYTDAQVVIVLDNVPDGAKLWDELVSHRAHDRTAIEQTLRRFGRLGTGEGRWLEAFARAALERDQLHRVTVHGLSQPDIVCYLPPEAFGIEHVKWPSLVAAWRAASSRPVDIKQWLRTTKGAKINTRRIESAAAQLAATGSPLPDDLTALAGTIRDASRRR